MIITNNQYEKFIINNKRDSIEKEIIIYGSNFEKEISSRVALLNGLEAFTYTNLDNLNNADFDIFAKGLLTSDKGIRNVIIAPQGINEYVYPIEGNEASVGHDQLNDERTQVRESVQLAIDTGDLVVSGPYELRQGGMGIIFKKAIYEDNGKFWGMISEVIDMDPLFEASGINSELEILQIAIKSDTDIIFGDNLIFDSNPVIYILNLPQGSLKLAAIPKLGWYKSVHTQRVNFTIYLILLSILIIIIIYFLSFRNINLKYLVRQKTKQLKQIDSKLRVQQRLESVGLLAGGVAHEINNPINGIINYAQLISEIPNIDHEANTYVYEIINESKRITEIVKNLLQFSRQEKQNRSYARIEDIINNSLLFIKTIIIRDQITLEVESFKEFPVIKCSSQQIQQVIMNILSNARDALNEKYVGYHENKIIKLYCKQYIKDNKKWIRITIEDYGNGIRKEIANRIFEPFYTTKDEANLQVLVYPSVME